MNLQSSIWLLSKCFSKIAANSHFWNIFPLQFAKQNTIKQNRAFMMITHLRYCFETGAFIVMGKAGQINFIIMWV